VSFADYADRLKTSHPSATIKHTAETFEVVFDGVTVTIKKKGKKFVVVSDGKDPVDFDVQREAEWHVSDEVNALWREREEKRPKRSSGAASYGGGRGGDDDDVLHVGGDATVYEPSDDD